MSNYVDGDLRLNESCNIWNNLFYTITRNRNEKGQVKNFLEHVSKLLITNVLQTFLLADAEHLKQNHPLACEQFAHILN